VASPTAHAPYAAPLRRCAAESGPMLHGNPDPGPGPQR